MGRCRLRRIRRVDGVWEGGEWGRKKILNDIGGCKIKVWVSAKDNLLERPTILPVSIFTWPL